jgi:hypothetical protein
LFPSSFLINFQTVFKKNWNKNVRTAHAKNLFADQLIDALHLNELMALKPTQFSRDASDRLTFEVYSLNADRYAQTCKRIARKFRLQPATELVVGLDEMFRDYTDGTRIVGLEWDNWSGFVVVAKEPDSESLVRSIGDFLSSSWRDRVRGCVSQFIAATRGR